MGCMLSKIPREPTRPAGETRLPREAEGRGALGRGGRGAGEAGRGAAGRIDGRGAGDAGRAAPRKSTGTPAQNRRCWVSGPGKTTGASDGAGEAGRGGAAAWAGEDFPLGWGAGPFSWISFRAAIAQPL
jgi:hypothetical protein